MSARILDRAFVQIRSAVHPWMTANLDGYAVDRVLECKTARTDQGWGDPGSDDVPQAYLLQVVHCMIAGENA